jgi:PAS domain S-box-containing protein
MPLVDNQLAPAARVFVVDDDKGLSRLIEKALQREGFLTANAGSFQEAVTWLERNRADLMLLDLKLEDIGGKELVDHLMAHGRSVPFIIITGQGDERVAVAMMKLGAMDYLVKDGDFLQFMPEVVRRALGQLERDRKLAVAEEALRLSEANLVKAQQIAHLGSFEFDVASASMTYGSNEIYRILGVQPVAGEPWDQERLENVVHPKDREAYRQLLHQAITDGTPFRLEHRIVLPDGSTRYVRSVAEPALCARGRVVKLLGTLLDITDRKRVELRQQVQYTTTRALAESSTLAEAAPKILEAVCRTLDWDMGEFWEVSGQGSSLRPVEIWPEPAADADSSGHAGRGLRLGKGERLPGRVWQTGKPLWLGQGMSSPGSELPAKLLPAGFSCAVALPILLGGNVLGVAAFFSRDARQPDPDLLQMFSVLGSQIGQFIDRQRAEEALRKEHAFSSTVLDTSAGLVVVLDRRGCIVRFNRACEQTTGYSSTEVKGQVFWDLFLLPEEMESVKAVFDRLRSGQFPNRHENHWRTRGGEARLVAWSNSCLLDDEGEVEYIISVGIDITERRRLEQEILKISELEQRRIGQDLHDGLCQHLAATELMTEILEQKLAKKSKADAARVAEVAKQVREAISQTRSLARGLSPVVLESEGLMSALQQLADYSERMFRIRCEFHCPTPVLVENHTAATHLYRIAQEALSNAVRHGRAKRVIILLQRTAERLVLKVTDDGVGLPEDLSKAEGMGLRIMQYRAAMSGGSLTVQHVPKEGTVVACTIQTLAGNNREVLNDHSHETPKG